MDYAGAIRFLDRFVNFEAAPASGPGAPRWELDDFRRFLCELGNPEQAFPSILVAGTKGKGSVAALIAAALRAGGLRVGLYTSPHLVSPRERIAVGDAPISEPEFAALVERIAPAVASRPTAGARYRTWFEIVTAMAFEHFRAARVDVSVLEVGLGGRLDATNVVEPLVSVITSISLDHTRTLGATRDAIAREKCGILRAARPAVISPQREDARAAILDEAGRRGAIPIEAGRDFSWSEREVTRGGSVIDFHGARAWHAVEVGLPGLFQIENAVVALRTVEALAGLGLDVGEAAVRSAFAGARWPGRFEEFGGAPPVLLDGAHNPYSVEELLRSVERIHPGRPIVALFAASRDKDHRGMLAALRASGARLVLTQTPQTRAAPIEHLVELARAVDPSTEPVACAAPLDGFARAIELAGPDGIALVTGSLYLVGAIREALVPASPVAPSAPAAAFDAPSPAARVAPAAALGTAGAV
jgi:dihydrofolate synthase/folylpolyglutamate synthase